MKASRLTSLVLVVAMGTLVGCGKKSKSSSGPTVSNSVYSGTTGQQLDAASTLASLKNDFNNKSLADGTSHNQYGIFRDRNVSSNDLFGINWLSYSTSSYSCSGFIVSGIPSASSMQVYLKTSTSCNNVYNQSQWSSGLTTYTKASNTLMTEFQNIAIASSVTQRSVYYNGTTYAAYEVVVNPTPFSAKIYVVSPALPFFLNPVAIYNSSNGSSSVVEGISIQ